jgi:hypothetical protein
MRLISLLQAAAKAVVTACSDVGRTKRATS